MNSQITGGVVITEDGIWLSFVVSSLMCQLRISDVLVYVVSRSCHINVHSVLMSRDG